MSRADREEAGPSMSNLRPLQPDEIENFEELFGEIAAMAGFIPNSLLTMARRPELARGFNALATAALRVGTVDDALKAMVAHVSSSAAGCLYCEAHTAATAVGRGVSDDRIAAIWDFERDARFSEAERAALRLARDAAQVPNAVTPAHFEALHEHFDDGQIVELVGVIATFGFLNRWNDTFATTLEEHPMKVAERTLTERGWAAGKHGA
jgi:uncharacterized peroxidase-related enzyme